MKKVIINRKFFTDMRMFLLCSVLAVCFTSKPLAAQDNPKSFAFSPGFGISIGGFYPNEVNQYISDDLSGYITTNEKLYMYESGNIFLNFKFKWFDVTALTEYAVGAKIIVGADKNYLFNRFSPGVLANFFIPSGKSKRHAFLIGGGIQYHMMSFEGFKGNTIGFRFQAGYDIQFSHINVQPILAFNLANAKEAKYNHSYIDLNYTGGQIGVNVSFHKPVLH
jgi:hypothetical protein